MTYKQFEIHTRIAYDGEIEWIIKRLDGSTLEESADTFDSDADAIEDAERFIDDWYKND